MHEFLYSKTSKMKAFLWERKQPKSSKNTCSILRDSDGKNKSRGVEKRTSRFEGKEENPPPGSNSDSGPVHSGLTYFSSTEFTIQSTATCNKVDKTLLELVGRSLFTGSGAARAVRILCNVQPLYLTNWVLAVRITRTALARLGSLRNIPNLP